MHSRIRLLSNGVTKRLSRMVVSTRPEDELPDGVDAAVYEKCFAASRRHFGRRNGRQLATLLAPFATRCDLVALQPAPHQFGRTPKGIVPWMRVRSEIYVSVSVAFRTKEPICTTTILSLCFERWLPSLEKAIGERAIEALSGFTEAMTGEVLRTSCGVSGIQDPMINEGLVWRQRDARRMTISMLLVVACASVLAQRSDDFRPLLDRLRSRNPAIGLSEKVQLVRIAAPRSR